MKQLTIDHTVILRPQVTIIQWVQSSPKTHRIGQAQESSIIKLKWYIQDWAKSWLYEFTALCEKISEISTEGLKQEVIITLVITVSPVKWRKHFDTWITQEKLYAVFTDGSAKYIGSTCYWKAVAYNLVTTKLLTTTRESECKKVVWGGLTNSWEKKRS